MKKVIAITVSILAVSMCILLSACGAGSVENTVQNSVGQTQESTLTQATATEYKYKVTGMQNIGKNENGIMTFSTESLRGNYVYVYAKCPQCKEMIQVDVYCPCEHVGEDMYVVSDSACCMNKHTDQFYNGWFDYSVMFTRVDE